MALKLAVAGTLVFLVATLIFSITERGPVAPPPGVQVAPAALPERVVRARPAERPREAAERPDDQKMLLLLLLDLHRARAAAGSAAAR